MKRRHDIESKRNSNAKHAVYNQYAYDKEGRKQFHGAFEGGFSAGYHNTVGSKEGFMPKCFIVDRQDKHKVMKMNIGDIMDKEDGIDYTRKEEEINKLMKFGMSLTEAEDFLESIDWDGNEDIHIIRKKNGELDVTFSEHVKSNDNDSFKQEVVMDKVYENDTKLNYELTHKDDMDSNEKQLKKVLKNITIHRVFKDFQKQKMFEQYLESLAENKSYKPLGKSEKEWEIERKEFIGIALNKCLTNKDDKQHKCFLEGFVVQSDTKEQKVKEHKEDNTSSCNDIHREIREYQYPPLLIKRMSCKN